MLHYQRNSDDAFYLDALPHQCRWRSRRLEQPSRKSELRSAITKEGNINRPNLALIILDVINRLNILQLCVCFIDELLKQFSRWQLEEQRKRDAEQRRCLVQLEEQGQ